MGKTVLVTGGAGYVGSHTILELLNNNFRVIAIDNFSNSCKSVNAASRSSDDDTPEIPESLNRVQKLTGQKIRFYGADILDKNSLRMIFSQNQIDYVVHCAALKAVGESTKKPLIYYQNNVTGTINLVEVMEEFHVYRFLYSSSATVYGAPEFLPLTEAHPIGNCTNPYGKSKHFTEEILQDLCKSNPKWQVISLRYFNPVGAHPSGEIGEDPNGEPNNLMPYIAQVCVGRRPFLKVYGNDYPTRDGTGVRDYVHIVDLAEGHIKALSKFNTNTDSGHGGYKVYNLGSGCGYSVLEMIKAFEQAAGQKIKYEIVARRNGDIAACYADNALAAKELDWTVKRGVAEMCKDLWYWQTRNPKGFSKL